MSPGRPALPCSLLGRPAGEMDVIAERTEVRHDVTKERWIWSSSSDHKMPRGISLDAG